MKIGKTLSHDGIELNYAISSVDLEKPNLVLIMPFGLELELAEAFFCKFEADYNVISWESRLILAPHDRQVAKGELTVENHVSDLFKILDANNIDEAILVGLCSGAGIALAAANQQEQRFSQLVLSNGDFTLLNNPECVTQHASDIDSLLPIASMDIDKAAFILEKIGSNKLDENVPPGIQLPFSQPHYFHRYAINYLSYRATDYEALASSLQHKTLFIAGKKDRQTNVDSALKVQRLVKNSTIHIEPEGDHYELFRPNSSALDFLSNYLSEEMSYAI